LIVKAKTLGVRVK